MSKASTGRLLLSSLRCASTSTSTCTSAERAVAVGASELRLKTGHIARMADGSAVAECGDSAILATVVSKIFPTASASDGVPLSVDYKASASALGRIPTNYLRRELSQSDADILTSRIIDRSIRPLFPKDFSFQTHVVCKPLALDENADGVVLGVNAAATALAVSPVPLRASVAAVRVAIVDGDIVVNPPMEQLRQAAMNLLISGTMENKILMIEMDGKEIDAAIFEEAVKRGFVEISKLTSAISDIQAVAGKKKAEYTVSNGADRADVMQTIKNIAEDRLMFILSDISHDKQSRDQAIDELRQSVVAAFADNDVQQAIVHMAFSDFVKMSLRKQVLEHGLRCDGRLLDEFRPISIEVDVYKKLHGSALFQRGQSQVLGTVTFDSPAAAFHPDSIAQLLGAQRKKMFMLHYEFPQFAVNSLGGSSFTNRRELGHGMLAEKALRHVVPETFPYCTRLACQVLESNGSTSMASACVGSLALYDAGVPLKAPVAGVAMGLMSQPDQETTEYRILTDLMGIEDYAGDMDFKIAGTSKGFTAMQLDLKTLGLSFAQLSESLTGARKGLDHVLAKMNEAIAMPREEFKSSVPIIDNMPVPPTKRSVLFRNGKFNALLIEAETGVQVTADDENTLLLLAPNKDKLAQAKSMISKLIEDNTSLELDFGSVYKMEIVEIREKGVFVRAKPNTSPLFIANHNLDTRKVAHASALGLSVGQVIKVQYLGRDAASGQHRLSRKLLQSVEQRQRSVKQQQQR